MKRELQHIELGKNDGHVPEIQAPAEAFIEHLFTVYGSDVAVVLIAVDGAAVYDSIFAAKKKPDNHLFLWKGFSTGTDVPVAGQVLGHPSLSQHAAMASKLEAYLRAEVLPNIVY